MVLVLQLTRAAVNVNAASGKNWHFVNDISFVALCGVRPSGATPKRRGSGWSKYEGRRATCKACVVAYRRKNGLMVASEE